MNQINSRPRSGSSRLAALLVLSALLLAPACSKDEPEDAEETRIPPILHIEEGTLRYSYQLVTGMESLFDLANDPRCLKNLALERPEDVTRMRRRIAEQYEVDDLPELREAYRDQIRRLESLGYL